MQLPCPFFPSIYGEIVPVLRDQKQGLIEYVRVSRLAGN